MGIHIQQVCFEDEQKWDIGGILRHKGSGRRRKYLVAYSGYDKSKAFWLPESDLYNALEIFNHYKVLHGLN